jgi:hypothetical protein
MKFLTTLEQKFRRYAVSNLTLLLISVQVSCLVAGLAQPQLIDLLALDPAKVLEGEVWRMATFLAVPTVQHPLWAFFFYYLFYLMGTALERTWGDFRYNTYLLIGYVATVGVAVLGASFLDTTNDVVSNGFLQGSVFLAFAWLYPDFQLLVMFILPVKVKWLALLTWIGYGFAFVTGLQTFSTGGWLLCLTILASVANFLLFFGPELLRRLHDRRRRADWQRRAVAPSGVARHRCTVCGITNLTHPDMEFRYCTQCADTPAYCQQHLRSHEHRQATASR